MVDEYQDTNTIQEKIYDYWWMMARICAWLETMTRACISFRGATIRNILEFPSTFEEGKCKQIMLTTNYRSHTDIVTFLSDWCNELNGRMTKIVTVTTKRLLQGRSSSAAWKGIYCFSSLICTSSPSWAGNQAAPRRRYHASPEMPVTGDRSCDCWDRGLSRRHRLRQSELLSSARLRREAAPWSPVLDGAGVWTELQHQQVLAEPPIANELDIAGDLLDGMFVVAGEVTCDAEQSRRRPIVS